MVDGSNKGIDRDVQENSCRVLTHLLNLDPHYDTDSVPLNPFCCAHRVRDRARKVRLVDRNCCDSAPIVESGGDERYALAWARGSMTTMSLRPGDSFVMLHGLSEREIAA